MYGIGTTWKFEIRKGIWYTGTVIAEDSFSIKIKTIREETIVLNREEISQAIEQNRTGEDY